MGSALHAKNLVVLDTAETQEPPSLSTWVLMGRILNRSAWVLPREPALWPIGTQLRLARLTPLARLASLARRLLKQGVESSGCRQVLRRAARRRIALPPWVRLARYRALRSPYRYIPRTLGISASFSWLLLLLLRTPTVSTPTPPAIALALNVGL